MFQSIKELKAENRVLEIARLFPRQGGWTEEDYFSLPETNRIIELSEGRLIISPSATSRHQRILSNLHLLIGNFVALNKVGEVITSPMDVRLWKGKIRQPDIIFMKNEHMDRIEERVWGVPDLIVEIISRGTAKRDRGQKYHEYQKAGVLEYWIVDPFEQTIEIYTLENETYVLLGKWSIGEIAYSKLLPGLQVAVDKVFE